MKKILVYGSYGYTGQLIVEHAMQEGLNLILAGRDEKRLREQAEKYKLEYRVFAVEETAKLDAALQEVDVVLHCAGPFVLTFQAMAASTSPAAARPPPCAAAQAVSNAASSAANSPLP